MNKLSYFTVIVNNGSGCLFQPADDKYSYVLTAKHVVKSNANQLSRQYIDAEGQFIEEVIEIIGEPYLHTNPLFDAAIFKVKPVKFIDGLLRATDVFGGNLYQLCGHPTRRQNDNNFTFRKNCLQIENTVEGGYIEAALNPPALYSEVIGQSGGGIIRNDEGCYLLAGIQKGMIAKDTDEALGRVKFMPLTFFDEIIASNSAELSPLVPPYIVSFERLLSEIFPFPNLTLQTLQKDLIQNQLGVIAKALCNEFSPKQILELYGENFLVNDTDTSIINHKQLWVSFLELLTYSQLHDSGELSLSQLKDLHKKRKLYIADTDAWTRKLEDIYKTDLSEIEKGGTVVVCATREKFPAKATLVEGEIVMNIAIPLDDMNISNTIKDPFKELRLVNVFVFQKNIIDNALVYKDINSATVKSKLIDETKNCF